jgi:hypothetical protein
VATTLQVSMASPSTALVRKASPRRPGTGKKRGKRAHTENESACARGGREKERDRLCMGEEKKSCRPHLCPPHDVRLYTGCRAPLLRARPPPRRAWGKRRKAAARTCALPTTCASAPAAVPPCCVLALPCCLPFSGRAPSPAAHHPPLLCVSERLSRREREER